MGGKFDFTNTGATQPQQSQQFEVAVNQPRRSSVQNSDFLFDSYAPSRQSMPAQLGQPMMGQPMMGQPQGDQLGQGQLGQHPQMPPRNSLPPAQNQNQVGGYDLDDLMGNQNSRPSFNFQTNPGVHPPNQQHLGPQAAAGTHGSLPPPKNSQNTPPQPLQNPVIHQNAYMQSHLQGMQQASQAQAPQVSEFDNFDNQFAGARRPQSQQQPPQQSAPVQQPQQRQPEVHSTPQDPFGGFNFDFGAQPAQTGFSNEFFGGSAGHTSNSEVFEFKAASKPKPQNAARPVPDFNNFFGGSGQQVQANNSQQIDFGFGVPPQSHPGQNTLRPQIQTPQLLMQTPQMGNASDYTLGASSGPTRQAQSQASNALTAEFNFPGQNSAVGLPQPRQAQPPAPQSKPQDRYSAFDDIALSNAPLGGADLGTGGMQLSNQMTFGHSHGAMQLPQMQSLQQGAMNFQSQPGQMADPRLQGYSSSVPQQASLDPFQFAAQQSMALNTQPQQGGAPAQPVQMSAEKKQAINAQLSALEDLLI